MQKFENVHALKHATCWGGGGEILVDLAGK